MAVLAAQNPRPPQFGSPSRKTIVIDPLKPTKQGNRDAVARGSPSRLFQMFETQESETDQTSAPSNSQDTAQQESSLPESPRASRTLDDLMGETQRQAMLDRILADMEQLAVEPTYSRLGQSDLEEGMKAISPRAAQRARSHKPSVLQTILRSELNALKTKSQHKQRKFTALWALEDRTNSDDDDDDDDIMENEMERDAEKIRERKRRQRRKLQQYNENDQAPLIFWQQTTGARSAADVPPRLIALSPSPPRRQRSINLIMPRRSHSSRQILSSSPDERRGSKRDSIPEIDPSALPKAAIPTLHQSSVSPKRRRRHVSIPAPHGRNEPAPTSPPKPHYGAWYVPQTEWWSLHQAEQQIIADKFPDAASHQNDPQDPPHCHAGSSSLQRQHKPPLPPAARSIEDAPSPSKLQTLRSLHPSGSRMASSNAPDLQVAGIPQSYIGREYRAFILSTGSAMPQYLQEMTR